MTKIMPIISQLNYEGISWENIDQSTILDLSENNAELPGMLARAIRLHYDENYTYEEPIYKDEENQELKMASIPKTNKAQQNTSQVFTISPNPANEYFIAEYTNTNAKEIVIQIFDIQGRLQLTQTLKNTTNQAVIDVNKLINGTYHCKLIVDGTQKFVSKLIIQH
jgi:hypothetical protein